MTSEQIERTVEARTDMIDRRFMNGKLTQEEYNKEIKDLSAWADRRYSEIIKDYK